MVTAMAVLSEIQQLVEFPKVKKKSITITVLLENKWS